MLALAFFFAIFAAKLRQRLFDTSSNEIRKYRFNGFKSHS